MIRLFVALPLPVELRRRLAALGSGIQNAHWMPEDNLHVTLRFIGEVDEAAAAEIHERLAAVRESAFSLTVAGCGAFGNRRRAHTLWVGVERIQPLMHLRDKVERAVVQAGQPPEGRRYSPHITLARLRDAAPERLQAFIAGHNLLKETVPVDRFVLFSSRLGHGDPVYTPEAEYPLVASAPTAPLDAGTPSPD